MTVRSAFLLCTIWAAFGSASAELVDIAWAVDGRFASQKEIPAGKFVEVCGKLPANLAVKWSFSATGPADFNIHYHQDKDVVYPAKLSRADRGEAVLQTRVEQDYCWMWTNKAATPISLAVQLQR